MEVLVEDLDVGRALDVASGDRAGATHVETQGDGLLGHRGDDDVLEVQDDVGDVFGDAGDRVELVERVVEADGRDRRAGDRRQEGATQRVAERVAEAGLERADRETLRLLDSSPRASMVGRCMTSIGAGTFPGVRVTCGTNGGRTRDGDYLE